MNLADEILQVHRRMGNLEVGVCNIHLLHISPCMYLVLSMPSPWSPSQPVPAASMQLQCDPSWQMLFIYFDVDCFSGAILPSMNIG